MASFRNAILLFAGCLFGLTAEANAKSSLGKIDMALVLAVDTSSSVNSTEYNLQRLGLAAALRDPLIMDAITKGPNHQICLNFMQWASGVGPKPSTGWYVISSRADAERFALVIEHQTRKVDGDTGIASAISEALRILAAAPPSTRSVVDVSGDGEETPSAPHKPVGNLVKSRQMASDAGVVINGLAIENEVPDLAKYYAKYVVEGVGSFVVSVHSYEDLENAIKAKLLREISDFRVATAR